jgi:hypothetical protein
MKTATANYNFITVKALDGAIMETVAVKYGEINGSMSFSDPDGNTFVWTHRTMWEQVYVPKEEPAPDVWFRVASNDDKYIVEFHDIAEGKWVPYSYVMDSREDVEKMAKQRNDETRLYKGISFHKFIEAVAGENWASNSKAFEKMRFAEVSYVHLHQDGSYVIGTLPRKKRDKYSRLGYSYGNMNCTLRPAGSTLRNRYGKDWVVASVNV